MTRVFEFCALTPQELQRRLNAIEDQGLQVASDAGDNPLPPGGAAMTGPYSTPDECAALRDYDDEPAARSSPVARHEAPR